MKNKDLIQLLRNQNPEAEAIIMGPKHILDVIHVMEDKLTSGLDITQIHTQAVQIDELLTRK